MKWFRLVARCENHPTYTGKRKPRIDCPACKFIHECHGIEMELKTVIGV